MAETEKLTDLQLELLKLFRIKMTDESMHELKTVLADYFQNKFDTEMDKIWTESGWTQETMEKWLHEHNRSITK